MTIKSLLILGEFSRSGFSWEFVRGTGLIKKTRNIATSTVSSDVFGGEYFIFPLINELGISITNINDNNLISSNNVANNSALLNNQYLKDNELITELSITQSDLRIEFEIPDIDGIPFRVDPIQKIAKTYSDILIQLFKNIYFAKNIIQFKGSNGDGYTFQVTNMKRMLDYIENYQSLITTFKGDYNEIINECNKIISKQDTKTKIGQEPANKYTFIKKLAEKKYDFVGSEFVIDSEESINTINNLTKIDLEVFIDITNIFYQSNIESGGVDGLIVKPIVDYTNCLYVDTKGNFLRGKLTSVIRSTNIRNSLDQYALVFSPNLQSNYTPPIEQIVKYETQAIKSPLQQKKITSIRRV